jgi:protein SCO1/2
MPAKLWTEKKALLAKGKRISQALILISILLYASLPAFKARAAHLHDDQPPQEPIQEVDFEQKLNQQLPLQLAFKDEQGENIRLTRYFHDKPVVLMFAYYECPMLCTLALNDLTQVLKQLKFDVGDQFEVLTVSIDSGETPQLAAEKKAAYLQEYGRPGAEDGWHFLTGSENSIQQLTQAAGFRFQYDAELDQYAHPTGIILLTPEGKISRYLLGIDYSENDLRLGLVDASARKIGTPVDQFFLLCYHYDPVTGKYSLVINNVLRLAALATTLLLGGLLLFLHKSSHLETQHG